MSDNPQHQQKKKNLTYAERKNLTGAERKERLAKRRAELKDRQALRAYQEQQMERTQQWIERRQMLIYVREMAGFQPTEPRCTWRNGGSVCGRHTKEFSSRCGLHRLAPCCGNTKAQCRENSIACTECGSEKKHCRTKMTLVDSAIYLCGDCFTRDYSRCMFCHDVFYDPDKSLVVPELAQCGECQCSQSQPCASGCMRCYS